MITQDKCKAIIDTAIAQGKGKADSVEVHVGGSDVATSRFANNGMTQNQSPSSVGVSVRVIVDGRQARLSTDKLDDEAIRQLVDNAIAAAKLLDKDPKLLPMLSPDGLAPLTSVNRFDELTAHLSPADRAHNVQSIVQVAKENRLSSAGTYTSGSTVEALGNSEGLFRFHKQTESGCSITMSALNSTGWTKSENPNKRQTDAVSMAKAAARKAIDSANSKEVDPGHYTVILEPSAVLDLMAFLWYDFAATSHIDKLSCFLGKVGQKVLGENITVYDDAYHPLQNGAPYDGEGVPRQKVTLVEKGVIKNLVYGRRAAKILGVEPTGHGLAEPNTEGEYPLNIVVEGGNTSLEEMIATTDRGILLTRVWYVREVDPTKKIVTGMTRDGTFLVENGKISKGIKNFRFNEGLIDMLNRVIAIGPSVRAAGEEGFPAVVPPMKVAYFNFDSVTKF
jgi:predicted Zn-dependent protease